MEKRTIIQRRSLADEVAEQVQKQIIDGELKEGELLITADTVVCLDAKILGKPENREGIRRGTFFYP